MADKRTEIENTAIAAIKRGGLASVSFRTLADAVGVKSASVHYHFPTKGDLSQAVVRRYTEDFEARLAEIRRTESGLTARLAAFTDLFRDPAREEDLCLCGMLSAEVENLDAGTRGALGTFFTISETWLEDVVAEADDRRSPLKPGQLARLIMAGLEGAALIDRVEHRTDHLDAWRAFVASLADTST